METRNFLLLTWLQMEYAEFKKYILYVKLTVYSWIQHILFVINLRVTDFRASFAVECFYFWSHEINEGDNL